MYICWHFGLEGYSLLGHSRKGSVGRRGDGLLLGVGRTKDIIMVVEDEQKHSINTIKIFI